MPSQTLRRYVIAAAVVAIVATVHAEQAPPGTLQNPNHETTTPAVAGITPATSLCAISEDPTYGTTPTNPVKVGGGAFYLAAREVRYLSALRGPSGQGVHFVRTGSLPAPDGTLLDAYTVDYPGQSVTLYMDGYHWVKPSAPRGWLCGAEMNLNPPGPDPTVTFQQLMTVAVGLGDQDVTPISADPDGSKTHGVIFDHVRLVAIAARQARTAGRPLDPKALPREVATPRLIAIAFPVSCEGRTIPPRAIGITDQNGNLAPIIAPISANRIGELVPGYTPPPNAVGVIYSVPALIEGAQVRIDYAEPCGANSPRVVLPVRAERGRVMASSAGVAPPNVPLPANGAQVQVQVILDAAGVPRFPVYVNGPPEFADAALAAVTDWRISPPTMNGAPIVMTVTVAVPIGGR